MAARKNQPSTSLLAALTFSNSEPVAAAANKQDPTATRRARFIASCELQRELVKHEIAGTKFSKLRKHYVVVKDAKGDAIKNSDGTVKKELREDATEKFRKWYWMSPDGTYALRARYSVRVIELQPGKPTIVAGKGLKSVEFVLLNLIEATKAGELDKPLMALKLGRKAS